MLCMQIESIQVVATSNAVTSNPKKCFPPLSQPPQEKYLFARPI